MHVDCKPPNSCLGNCFLANSLFLMATFQNKFVSSIVITKYFYCGLFNDRVTFLTFLAFVHEGMLCKGQMESIRCGFVMSICVNSKSGVTCCWLWKGNCSEGHCNVGSILFLEHGLHD